MPRYTTKQAYKDIESTKEIYKKRALKLARKKPGLSENYSNQAEGLEVALYYLNKTNNFRKYGS